MLRSNRVLSRFHETNLNSQRVVVVTSVVRRRQILCTDLV